jgi:hypothetical protein
MGKHFGESIIEQVLVMKERGITHRAIAKEFGLTKAQIKHLVKRYNRARRAPIVVSKHRGRPRKQSVTKQDYLRRIKQLEMEVELFKSFLQTVGRM